MSPGSKYKKRSLIWNHFDQTSTPDVNGCKYCPKVFKCKGQTTSSMIRHLKIEHKDVYNEFSALTASVYGRKIGESLQKFQIPAPPSIKTELDASGDEDNEEVLESVSVPNNSNNIIRPGKRRSSIWNYFVPTNVPDNNACKICNKVFKCKSRTTSKFLRFRDVVKSSESSDTVKKEPSSSKTDPIWNYFQKSNESKDVSECIECKIQIHAKSQLGIVSSMVTHLETTHADSYDTYCNQGGGGGGSGRVEEDSSLMCAECGDKFSNRASLTQHMKIAHAASCPYKCEECNASFTRRDSFEQHSHDKNKPRNYLCTICGKTFARRSIRNFHEKAHRAEKKYECGFCPKKFLTNQRKYKHERTHTGEKPYQCTECGRQFTQSHHLVTHARIHTGLKPYNCDLCPQTFRHLSSRNNHKCEGKLRAGIHDHLEEIHPLAYERFILQFNNDQESVMNFFQKGDLRRKSLVWDYFSPLDSNSETSACNLCLKVFRCKGQTFALLRHLKTEHFEVYSEFSQSNLSVIPPQSCKSEPSERREELESVSGKTDDPQVIACKDCSKDIVCKELSSLSNLVKHLKTDHNNSYLEYSEFYASKSDILSLKPEPQDIDEEDEDYPMASEFLEEEEVDQKEMEGRVEENNEVIHEGNNEIGEIDEDQEEDVEDEEVEEEQEDEEEGREEEDTNFQKLNKRKHSFFKSSETQGSFNCKLCSQEFKCKDGDLTLLSLHLKIAHPEVNIDSQVRFKPGVNYVEEEEEEDNESTEDDDALRECKSCYKDIYAEIMAQRAGERDGEGMEMDPGSLFDDSPTKYKKRSLIWNYFKTTDVPFMNSCKFCSKVFKCKGQTTSSMIRHLKIEHLEVFEEFSALTASINGRRIGESPRKYFSPLDFVGKDLPPSDDESPQNLSSSQQSDHLESNFSSEDAHSADALGNIISSGGAVKGPGAKRRSSIWNYFVGTEEHEMNACRHVELFNEFLCTKDRPRDPLEVSLSIKKEKKRSPIWNYYDKTESPGTNECRTCKKQFKCKGQSTFNMIRHLESNHPSIYQAFLSEGGRAGGEETQICAECGKHVKCAMPPSHGESLMSSTLMIKINLEISFVPFVVKPSERRSIRDFHEKAHDAEKKYQCAYCPKKFLTNQRKYKHERTHTGEKPYQCTDCGRQFTLSHHLVTHSRIHTGQKPYSCDFCPQTFRHLSSRNNHKCEGKLRINPQS
ncbi:KRAB [Lepeophtheirus salmonis]|uniref:KRAB n=1 Tax=Lepeophtheirus salmonis TaxID=72036 RepID=A0A7R8CFP2_LEPSM|nr:KRAB [Lepeophtheirus salmonis]CAF2808445.1 KRAB [Lepeophtheirus salmonis]